jgi:hypothetical protein
MVDGVAEGHLAQESPQAAPTPPIWVWERAAHGLERLVLHGQPGTGHPDEVPEVVLEFLREES